jgi:putative SOS response-associated peptidase YedK
MSGYFEWKNSRSGKHFGTSRCATDHPRSPLPDCQTSVKNCETGERLKSCAMIITATNDLAAEIHDRMPAFLRERNNSSLG